MGIRVALSGLLTSALMAVLVTFAPTANAAGVCSDLADRTHHKTIKRHGFVFRGWTSNSTDRVCWVLRRADGRRANVDMLVERFPTVQGKSYSSNRRQFWNVRRVTKYHKTTNTKVVIQIYAGKGGPKTNPMNFIGRMKFPAE